MKEPRSVETITDDTIRATRERIKSASPQHAAALVPGCRFWEFTNPEGFKGQIIIWPDNRAALISAAASHWGEWNDDTGQILLDTGDVYNGEGGVGEDA